MKQAVKTIVDSIEKEIDLIKENIYLYDNNSKNERDFEFGTLFFELEILNKKSIGGEWDEILNETFVTITPDYIDVTNENSKVLTNLSNEVFNQLELTYTNY